MQDNQQILVIGCGYVGSVLAANLRREGHSVIGVTSSLSSAENLSRSVDFPVQSCDIGDAQAVAALASSLEESGTLPSDIIHCASSGRGGIQAYEHVYLEGVRNMVARFPDSHLLFTSSTSVYPQTDGSEVDEDSDTEPSQPTGKILLEAEAVALQSGGSVVRLSGIYGPGRWYLVRIMAQNSARIEVNENAPDGRYINCIHRDDAAGALSFVATRRIQGVFNATDNTPLSQREAYSLISRELNLPMPPDGFPNHGRKRAWTHKRVSNQKLRSLGWHPNHPGFVNVIISEPDVLDTC